MEDTEQILKKSKLGSGWLWAVIFTVNIIERLGNKLRRIILFQFELVSLRNHFGKDLKPLMFTGRVHYSQNQYYLSVETPGYSKEIKRIWIIPKVFLGNIRIWEIKNFESVGKGGDRNIPKIRLFFENLQYGINIFQRT